MMLVESRHNVTNNCRCWEIYSNHRRRGISSLARSRHQTVDRVLKVDAIVPDVLRKNVRVPTMGALNPMQIAKRFYAVVYPSTQERRRINAVLIPHARVLILLFQALNLETSLSRTGDLDPNKKSYYSRFLRMLRDSTLLLWE